jgi:23S rRNA pseudouridine1911/1915/1917 synthase
VTAAIKLSSPATREFWEIPVLFEDDHLLALDKPAQLLTSPDASDPARPSMMKLLHGGIADGKPWARDRGLEYLNQANELDFEATGVLLLAKSKPAFVALANLFSAEKARMKYLALVRGDLLENQFEVNARLSPHPVAPGLMRVDSQGGKAAVTQCEVREVFPRHGFALLQASPRIERLHQVRVHASHVGLKIVGDKLYGGKPLWLSQLKRDYRLKPGREERPLLGRVALHAEELNLPHPVSGENLTVKSELPKDFRVALKYLRQFSA